MNKSQRDYLTKRLHDIASKKQFPPNPTVVLDTPEIAEARRLVIEFDRANQVSANQRYARITQARLEIEDALFFSEETEVIAALRAFEATEF